MESIGIFIPLPSDVSQILTGTDLGPSGTPETLAFPVSGTLPEFPQRFSDLIQSFSSGSRSDEGEAENISAKPSITLESQIHPEETLPHPIPMPMNTDAPAQTWGAADTTKHPTSSGNPLALRPLTIQPTQGTQQIQDVQDGAVDPMPEASGGRTERAIAFMSRDVQVTPPGDLPPEAGVDVRALAQSENGISRQGRRVSHANSDAVQPWPERTNHAMPRVGPIGDGQLAAHLVATHPGRSAIIFDVMSGDENGSIEAKPANAQLLQGEMGTVSPVRPVAVDSPPDLFSAGSMVVDKVIPTHVVPRERQNPGPSQDAAPILHLMEDGRARIEAVRNRPTPMLSFGSENESAPGRSLQNSPSAALTMTSDADQTRPERGGRSSDQVLRFTFTGQRLAQGSATIRQDAPTFGTGLIRDSESVFQIDKMIDPPAVPLGSSGVEAPEGSADTRLPMASRDMRMLSDIIQKMVWHQENGQAQARIQLKPAFLGHLHLEVLTDQMKVRVEIRAETPLVRDFLEMNLQHLKTELQQSGLEVDKIDVLVDPDMDNPQGQQRGPLNRQAQRLNGDLKSVRTVADKDTPEPQPHVIADNGEGRINCFI